MKNVDDISSWSEMLDYLNKGPDYDNPQKESKFWTLLKYLRLIP